MLKNKKTKTESPKQNRRIVVAMSGGVDSSVAVALLKKQDFDVVGVFMKFWKPAGYGNKNRCCTLESEKRARQIAKILDIPFYVLNLEKEFKKRVVNYFLKEYKKGVTPNPCVVCNKEIKFGLLLEKALKLKADFIATGHYARIENGKLLKGKDEQKDQSYFLWQLNQKQLSRILFPVGCYVKSEVRELARKFKLPTAETPESMEICFTPQGINNFLAEYIKEKPGKIINQQGKILGKHNGPWFYTIGQRKGIGLPGGPYFVANKDIKKNLLIVTKNEKDLYKKELIFKNVNWISGKEPNFPFKIEVKIRYRSQSVPAVMTKNIKSEDYNLKFDAPQRAITPGQSVVFYAPRRSPKAKAGKGEELIGGGIIQ